MTVREKAFAVSVLHITEKMESFQHVILTQRQKKHMTGQ